MSGYPFIDSPARHSGLWLKKTSFVYSLDPESPITGVMAAKASEIPPIIPGDLLTSSYIHARLSSCFSLVLPLWKGISIWINQNPAQPRPGTTDHIITHCPLGKPLVECQVSKQGSETAHFWPTQRRFIR